MIILQEFFLTFLGVESYPSEDVPGRASPLTPPQSQDFIFPQGQHSIASYARSNT